MLRAGVKRSRPNIFARGDKILGIFNMGVKKKSLFTEILSKAVKAYQLFCTEYRMAGLDASPAQRDYSLKFAFFVRVLRQIGKMFETVETVRTVKKDSTCMKENDY